MAQCHLCQKDLGFLEKKVQILVEGKKEFFCLPCANAWPQQLKNSAILSLYSSGEPTVLFFIPSVLTHYEDDPGNGLVGPLLFTNNSLCFAQLQVAQTRNPFYNIGYKIGSAVAGATRGEPQEIKEIGPSELKRIVDASSRLIVLPKERITEIKYKDGVEVKIGSRSQRFKIQSDKKEAAAKYESLVRGYLR